MLQAMYELITIAFSHYCEKARWALDRNRVPYREHKYMPAMHMLATRRALRGTRVGRADKASSRFSTPILFGKGAPIADSSDIVRHIEPALFEDPEAERLDRYFSDELGPHSRRVVYWFGLNEPEILHRMARDNVSVAQALAFRAVFPIGGRYLRDAMKIDEGAYQRSLGKVRRIAEEVEGMLEDGRPYLLGDQFSVADLSFASMMAPGILPGPDVFGAVLPPVESLSPEPAALVRELRARPAGQFAMRMFSEERWPAS